MNLRRWRAALAAAMIGVATAAAQSVPPNARLLTTDPEDDYAPVVSPDGRWLVFVSERDGDPNIHALDLSARERSLPRALAPSPAVDTNPIFSHDGRWLAWISTREDAFGDVWVMRFPNGEPIQVSRRGDRDFAPQWIARGRTPALHWMAETRDGVVQPMEALPGQWRARAVPEHATPRPERRAHLELRHVDDTNGDGEASEASGDAPSVWEVPPRGTPRQLTPPLPGLNAPQWHRGVLLFSAALRGNQDVVLLDEPFEVATLTSAAQALEAARRSWRDEPLRPFEAVALARQGYLLAPDSDAGKAAYLLMLDILRAANRPEQALREIRDASHTVENADVRAGIEWRRAVLEIEEAVRALQPPEEVKQLQLQASGALLQLFVQTHLARDTRARTGIELARLQADVGWQAEAIDTLDAVTRLDGVPRDLHARAGLAKARLYALAAPEEARSLFLAVLRDYPDQLELREDAALEFAHSAMEGATLDERVLALRAAAAAVPDLAPVQAAAELLEGRAFAAAGDLARARRALGEAIAHSEEAPRLAAQAAFELAEIMARQGQFLDAIDTYEGVAEEVRNRFFAEAPRFYTEAQEGFIRQFLAKGHHELRLGDPYLARATFDELLGRMPDLVEGWRGLLEALDRTGQLTPDRVAQFRREARAAPDDSLAWYKHGLALTYEVGPGKRRERISTRAVEALERAIALDASVPYYHQTLGFVREHYARLEKSRSRQLQHAVVAASEYERALALLDAARRPEDHARLLVNAGNAAFALESFARAAYYYERRLAQSVPFDDPRTEFLMMRSLGIAQFRGFRTERAAESFRRAQQLLAVLLERKLVAPDAAEEMRTELLDREALALMESGREREAAELFARVAERRPANSMDRARALRNRGFALHRLSRRVAGPERQLARREAMESLERALELVRSRDLVVPRRDQPTGGLFGFTMTLAASEYGAAADYLTADDEERLIQAAVARLRVEGGDTQRAAEALEEQLAAQPPLSEGTVAYYSTARLIMLDQLAVELERLGRRDEALQRLAEAIDSSRVEVKGVEQINAAGLSRVLMRTTEMLLRGDVPAGYGAQLRATWLGRDAEAATVHELLDAMLARALTRRDAVRGEHLMARPAERARLLMGRALLAEHASTQELAADSLAALRSAGAAARAVALADRVLDEAMSDLADAEAKRLGVLASGLKLRIVARMDEASAARQQSEALRAAADLGYGDMTWWLHAQRALAGTEEQRIAAAIAALQAIEQIAPGIHATHAHMPHELLAHLEGLSVRDAASRGDWAQVLARAERWSAARLKLAMDGVEPAPRAGNAADAEWLERAREWRAAHRAAAERLRALPFTGDAAAAKLQLRRARERWERHLAEGRARNLPSALLLDPRATPIENPAEALRDALALPRPLAVLVISGDTAVAWTDEGPRALASIDDWRLLLALTRRWFVLGSGAIPDEVAPNVSVVRLLTFETTLLAMSELRLDMGTGAEDFPGDGDAADALARLAGVADLRIEPPLRATSANPYEWPIETTDLSLGGLLAATRGLDRVETTLAEAPAGVRSAEALARRPLLAAILAREGAAEARVDGEQWLGLLVAARDLPEVAEAELQASIGLVRSHLERGDAVRALAPARRIHALRRALERPAEEVAESGALLAQILGDLRRHGEAAAVMREVVVLRRESGTEEELASALALFASYAGDAREFDDAQAAYEEAAQLYSALDIPAARLTMIARAGVVCENAGRYPQALDLYRKALALAQEQGDGVAIVEQWRRIGRVYLVRQNDYLRAEEAFAAAREAAREAGDEETALLAQLDLARVDERLGHYEAGIEKAAAIEQQAQSLAAPLLEIDAILVRAFILWAQADYFEAYKAQRHALDLAEQQRDEPFRIIAHNTGGLIAWALNDTPGAMREFNAAMTLARESLFPGEVASTLNNRALVFRSMQEFDAALEDLAEARRIDLEQQNRWGYAYAQKNIGITYLQRGEAALAVEPLEEAVAVAGEIGDRTNRAKSLVALADAERETGRRLPARDSYVRALAESRAIPLPEVEWRALYGLALLARAEGNTGQTRRHLADAIEVVERIRARIRIEEFQDGFLLDKQELYDDMVSLLLDDGDATAALEYSERARARNFIDLLGNQKIDYASVEDQRAIERENELRRDIEELERRAAAAEQESGRAAITQRLEEARRRYADFLIELRAHNPQLSGFVEVDTIRLPALQALLEPDTRLVVYHVLPGEVVAWVVGPQSLDVVRTPIEREQLAARIRDYRADLQDFGHLGAEAAILSGVLWRPVAPLLAGARRAGIVPHRELHLMPFASLPTDTGHVIDRLSLFHSPSASVLQYTFARRGQRTGNLRVLAIGNPELGTEAAALPFAEKEAQRVAWTFPDADVITGTEATETWVRQHIGNYGIVHLATHGEYDPNLPLLSAIHLAPDGENDGRLTAREVFALSLNADLVALSACQTGLGRLTSGDEVIGLNRSFVYSGTRQILSSLWRVDDVSTAVLVKHFYRNMREEDRAEALRRAQLEVRSRYPHPAHWAGLFLLGDWQ